MERYVQWLSEAGIPAVIVRAGAHARVVDHPWGTEVVVRDPLRLYREAGAAAPENRRKPNSLRRRISYQIFNPDPTIVWARKLARDTELLRRLDGTTHIIASNPPESVHVGAAVLARRLGAAYVMDMRDGWLDEPLRSLLQTSPLRRWRESRLERRCVAVAQAIVVTSETWKRLLVHRYPGVEPKVHVITNAYPARSSYAMGQQIRAASAGLRLIYAGRFYGSDPRRSPKVLLDPLVGALHRRISAGEILLPGDHGALDLDEIDGIGQQLPIGWSIEAREPMPRSDLLRLLADASGLLMLTASQSQIPAKLFEYLPTGRPILAVAPADSEVVRFCRAIPHVFTISPTPNVAASTVVEAFLDACSDPTRRPVPSDYSQQALGHRFLEIIAK